MTVSQLIESLRRLEKITNIELFDGDFFPRDNPDALEVSYLADTVLVTPNGNVDWDAVDVLREAGYAVFPVEKDRFGWLIGGISTRVGILTYG